MGIIAAGIFFLGTLFLGGGGIYVGEGVLLNSFWATHIGDASNAPAWWVFGAIVVVLVLVLNYLGVRLAIRAMLAFAAVSFIPMIILAFAIIFQGGADGNTLSVFNPGRDVASRSHRRRRAGRHPARHPAVRRIRGCGLAR